MDNHSKVEQHSDSRDLIEEFHRLGEFFTHRSHRGRYVVQRCWPVRELISHSCILTTLKKIIQHTHRWGFALPCCSHKPCPLTKHWLVIPNFLVSTGWESEPCEPLPPSKTQLRSSFLLCCSGCLTKSKNTTLCNSSNLFALRTAPGGW